MNPTEHVCLPVCQRRHCAGRDRRQRSHSTRTADHAANASRYEPPEPDEAGGVAVGGAPSADVAKLASDGRLCRAHNGTLGKGL